MTKRGLATAVKIRLFCSELQTSWKRPRVLATCFIILLTLTILLTAVLPPLKCADPSMTLVVLTSHRPASLSRLLSSLSSARYGCARVDLLLHVDLVFESRADILLLLREMSWSAGKKTILSRVEPAGLSKSWFESTYDSGTEYVVILEDDMEISPQFYRVFKELHKRGVLSGEKTTGFCLHPGDWEVYVPIDCADHSVSRYLYLTPEPCNWGPIWKALDWQSYIDWVVAVRQQKSLPYVPERFSYNFNKYLRAGQDVQSPWVWRYNYENGKRFVRYSLSKCDERSKEKFLAINHKEIGVHFSQKVDLDTDPALLLQNAHVMISKLASEDHPFVPREFGGYLEYQKSLHG